jgi:hypothetical protein
MHRLWSGRSNAIALRQAPYANARFGREAVIRFGHRETANALPG